MLLSNVFSIQPSFAEDDLAKKFQELRERGLIRERSAIEERLMLFTAQPFHPSDGEIINLVAFFRNNGRPVYGTVRIELTDKDGNILKTILEPELGAHAASEEDINYDMDRDLLTHDPEGRTLWRYECAVEDKSAYIQARLRWVRERTDSDDISSKVDPLRDKDLLQIDGSYLHDAPVRLTAKPFEEWKDWQKEYVVTGTHWEVYRIGGFFDGQYRYIADDGADLIYEGSSEGDGLVHIIEASKLRPGQYLWRATYDWKVGGKTTDEVNGTSQWCDLSTFFVEPEGGINMSHEVKTIPILSGGKIVQTGEMVIRAGIIRDAPAGEEAMAGILFRKAPDANSVRIIIERAKNVYRGEDAYPVFNDYTVTGERVQTESAANAAYEFKFPSAYDRYRMKVRWKEDGVDYEHITPLPELPSPQTQKEAEEHGGSSGSGEPDYMEMLNTYGPLAILIVAAPFVLGMMKKAKQRENDKSKTQN